MKKIKKKIVLAFSGGLDTSFCIPYLIEKGYEVITVTVDTGGFNPKELQEIAKKSKKFGALKHYQINGKKFMFDQIVAYVVKANALYQGSYPHMCSDRYAIAEESVKVAKKEKITAIAHGSTAMGNDQVRFDVALMTIAPEIQIVTPIREMGGNRQEEKLYLQKKGFPVSTLHKKYSVNQNILGVTYSGSEIDNIAEPDGSMFQWTKLKKTKAIYLTIDFEKGLPTALNGKKMDGADILQALNTIVGGFGYGQGYYTGDCIVGIKGHIVFEAPGILALLEAHKALEQLVLTKPQQQIGKIISEQFSDLLYVGKFYDPAVQNIKKFIDAQQSYVTGTVTVKLSPQQVQAVSLVSAYSLINKKIANYAQSSTWTAQDAEGFIKLFGLQGKIAKTIQQEKPDKKGKNSGK